MGVTYRVVVEVRVRRGRLVTRDGGGIMVGFWRVGAEVEEFPWRAKRATTLRAGVGTTGGARDGVGRVGVLPATRTVRVQLKGWTIVVVLDHLVTVRVLHTVRSLRGGGGGREVVGAVVTAVVVDVAVTVTVSSAGSTGLPQVRGRSARRPRSL